MLASRYLPLLTHSFDRAYEQDYLILQSKLWVARWVLGSYMVLWDSCSLGCTCLENRTSYTESIWNFPMGIDLSLNWRDESLGDQLSQKARIEILDGFKKLIAWPGVCQPQEWCFSGGSDRAHVAKKRLLEYREAPVAQLTNGVEEGRTSLQDQLKIYTTDDADPLPARLMQKYIAYARAYVHPSLSPEAKGVRLLLYRLAPMPTHSTSYGMKMQRSLIQSRA